MLDPDHTFTSPLSGTAYAGPPLLALTVLWHPDPARIGAQYLQADTGQALEVSRFFPLFAHPGRDGLGLGHGSVSRQPLRLARDTGGRLALTPPDSRMTVEVNGSEIAQAVVLERPSSTAASCSGWAVRSCCASTGPTACRATTQWPACSASARPRSRSAN
jgi:hypothetical protein